MVDALGFALLERGRQLDAQQIALVVALGLGHNTRLGIILNPFAVGWASTHVDANDNTPALAAVNKERLSAGKGLLPR
jgi:hypothetical protein